MAGLDAACRGSQQISVGKTKKKRKCKGGERFRPTLEIKDFHSRYSWSKIFKKKYSTSTAGKLVNALVQNALAWRSFSLSLRLLFRLISAALLIDSRRKRRTWSLSQSIRDYVIVSEYSIPPFLRWLRRVTPCYVAKFSLSRYQNTRCAFSRPSNMAKHFLDAKVYYSHSIFVGYRRCTVKAPTRSIKEIERK